MVGWNFGEGHLHNEQLLRAVQAQCGFEEGELRVICVESQPLFTQASAWRVYDAAGEGSIEIDSNYIAYGNTRGRVLIYVSGDGTSSGYHDAILWIGERPSE